MDTTRALFEMPPAVIAAVPILLLLLMMLLLRRRICPVCSVCSGKNTAKPRRVASVMCVMAAAAMSLCLAACTDAVSQEPGAELVRKIEETSGSNVVDSIYADFDGDGADEVFAVTGDGAKELWYASAEGCVRPEWDGMTPGVTAYEYGGLELLELKSPVAKLELAGKDGRTLLFGVRDGAVSELEDYPRVRSLTDNGGGSFTGFEPGEEGKPYWFRYNSERGVFREYGAAELDCERLMMLENAESLVGALPEEADITGILYRENGIININYLLCGEKRYMTLRLEGWALSDVTGKSGGAVPGYGEYSRALSESLATVPLSGDPVLRLGTPAYPEWFEFEGNADSVPVTYYPELRRTDKNYTQKYVDWDRATGLLSGLGLSFAAGDEPETPLGCAPFELVLSCGEKRVTYRFEGGAVTIFDESTPEGQRCAVQNPGAMERFMAYVELANPDASTLGEAEGLSRADIVSVEYIERIAGRENTVCTLSGKPADRALDMLLGQFVRPVREGDSTAEGGSYLFRLTLADGTVREIIAAGVISVDGAPKYAGFSFREIELGTEFYERADGSIETLPMDCRRGFVYTHDGEAAEGFAPYGTADIVRIDTLDGMREYYESRKDIFEFGGGWLCSDGQQRGFESFMLSLSQEEFFADRFFAAVLLGDGSNSSDSYFVPDSLKLCDGYLLLKAAEYSDESPGTPGRYTLMLLALPREYLETPLDVITYAGEQGGGLVCFDGGMMTADDVRELAGRAESGERISWDELGRFRGILPGTEYGVQDVYRVDFPVEGGGLLSAWNTDETADEYPDRVIYTEYGRTIHDGNRYFDILAGEAP